MNTPRNLLPDWGKSKENQWIQTHTGIRFFLLSPLPGDFAIEDIAHALANQCRFAGHTKKFYSVAEHSVRVARYVESKWRGHAYSALMHDASDAYMLDMPRPFKYLPEFEVYKDIEHKVMAQMAAVLGFRYPKPELVHKADNVLLATEARDLFDAVIDDWHLKYGEMLPFKIRPWSPRKAKREFLKTFYRLNPLGIKPTRRIGTPWIIKAFVDAAKFALAMVHASNAPDPFPDFPL